MPLAFKWSLNVSPKVCKNRIFSWQSQFDHLLHCIFPFQRYTLGLLVPYFWFVVSAYDVHIYLTEVSLLSKVEKRDLVEATAVQVLIIKIAVLRAQQLLYTGVNLESLVKGADDRRTRIMLLYYMQQSF